METLRERPEADMDPVCGVELELKSDAFCHEHEGHVYQFCSERCQKRFAVAPSEFVEAVDPVAACPLTARLPGGVAKCRRAALYLALPSAKQSLMRHLMSF